ncbi:hypothetical protein [Haloarchaeobius sp. TZWWS8]|uniref:hypothetical protein n=1 Tax=Haloarchaeobius sp. TZWWS8 TaxID=3446121 RepID=UPI003EBB467C
MLRFDCHGVYGGWETAVSGPSDHIEFAVVRDDEQVFHSYGSLHALLRLYDLARLERASHPRFLGYEVTERVDGITVDFQLQQVETTYAALREALEPFLGAVFASLDEQTVGDRDEHIDTIHERDEVLVDLHELRGELT